MAETTKKRTQWRAAKSGGKKTCTVEGCKRPYRAKGYCFFHYDQWREGKLGHARYNTCSKPDCKKKVFKAGMCEQHYNEATGKGAAAPA